MGRRIHAKPFRSFIISRGMSEQRRFPPPWSVDDPDMKLGLECFIVRDGTGQACLYFEDEPGRRAATDLLTPR